MAYKDKAQAVKYNNDFIKSAYDRINLTVPKGRKALLQEAAREQYGGKVNSLINALIDTELERMGLLLPPDIATPPQAEEHTGVGYGFDSAGGDSNCGSRSL